MTNIMFVVVHHLFYPLPTIIAIYMSRTRSHSMKLKRNQLKSMTKGELVDSISSTDSTDKALQTITTEWTALRRDSRTKWQIHVIWECHKKDHRHKQADIILSCQKFLEDIDRKERECNLLGVPNDNKSLDGTTTDEDMLQKVWEATGVTSRLTGTTG